MRTVIAFDVSDDKRRAKLVKVLLSYAHRVQKSVFEADSLPEAVFLKLRSKVERYIEPKTDRIRYYRMCVTCGARTELSLIHISEPTRPY